MFICEICGKEFEKGIQLGGHKSSFHNEQRKKNIKEKNKLKKIKIIKKCPKCNKEFEVIRVKNKNGTENIPKKEKVFCSRSCANGHIQKKETKEKISFKNKGRVSPKKGKTQFEKKYCPFCGKELTNRKSKTCIKCSFMNKDKIEKIKKSVLEQYKNGKKVFGGTTKWVNYKNIKVQGSYEYRACIILDNLLENKKIKHWEYTKDRINYSDENGEQHSYLLDFKVIENDGSVFYIETKGFIRKRDLYKWEAAKSQGLNLKVWFLKDLEEQEKMASWCNWQPHLV